MDLLAMLNAGTPAPQPIKLRGLPPDAPHFYPRTLSLQEAEAVAKLAEAKSLPPTACWITIGAGNAEGKRVFTDEQADAIAKLPVAVGKALCTAILEHNGLTEEEIADETDAAAKNA